MEIIIKTRRIIETVGDRIVLFIDSFPGRLPDQVQAGATHHGTVK